MNEWSNPYLILTDCAVTSLRPQCATQCREKPKTAESDRRFFYRGSPSVIGICAPAAPPIMLRIGTHSLSPIPNPNPNPNPTHEHTVTLGLQLSVLRKVCV